MKRIILFWSLFLAASSLTIQAQTAATDSLPWAQSVAQGIDELLRHDMFQTSQVGLMVLDLEADSVVYQHNARQTLRPASCMKIITAVAALDQLGGSYRFKTALCYTGTIEGRTLSGDVYCVGGMDPKFNADDMKAFVESLRKLGVDTLRGRLLADKSMKDPDLLGAGWCWDDDNPVLSALPYGRNDAFMPRFLRELRADGIVVESTMGEGRKPSGATCIVERFHTIDQILMRMMKESDNLYAESMFYQLAATTGARPAKARHARAAIEKLIQKTGLNPAKYEIADGCGLSLYNYVSAELLARLLRYAWQNDNIATHLLPSLPRAGVDGTLKSRLKGAKTKDNVKAKTGTVEGISSLAGYCRAPNGHPLAFAIINQGILHTSSGKWFQDKVCEILCNP